MRRRDERGAAALEFGLVVTAFLMVLMGIIQYGYHFWALTTASATAREAARALIVGNDWSTCAQSYALEHASGPAIGGGGPSASFRYLDPDGNPLVGTPGVGDLVEVTVTFQSLFLGLPFLPVPDDGLVSQSAVDEIENVPASVLSCDTPGNL